MESCNLGVASAEAAVELSRVEALMLPDDFPDVLDMFPGRPEWMTSAACRGSGPAAFFSSRGDVTDEARELCGGCSVRGPCLSYALAEDLEGVWAATSKLERRAMRRKAS